MLHQKGAHEDFLRIIKTHLPLEFPAVLHSFTGSFEEATDYINLGMYIGITGNLCFFSINNDNIMYITSCNI